MEDIVYENEVLPELEIEEVLTLEQMLAFQPRFVAFSDQEILAHIHQLLKSTPQRAEIFARLHRQVIHKGHKPLNDRVRFAPHGLSRKTYEDDEFISEMNEAKQASSYEVQQMGVDRVMFPFVLDQDVSLQRPVIEDDVDIEMPNDFLSRILKRDPVQVPIDGARWKGFQPNSHPDYVFDTPLSTVPFPLVTWSKGDSMDIGEWVLEKVRPGIQDVIKAIMEPVDVHTLHRILAKHGHDMQALRTTEFEQLQKHMQQFLDVPEPPTDDEVTPIPASKFKKGFVDLHDMLKNESDRAMFYTKDDESMRMETAYRNILQRIPPMPQQVPLSAPIEIAKDLRTGASTLENVAEQLIQWYLRWFLDNLTRFMERYHQNDIDMDRVDAYVRKMQHVGESKMLTSVFDFINQYSDVAELKEGNDTSAYDGTPSIVPETIFEENANEEYTRALRTGDEPDALHLFDNTIVDTAMPTIANLEDLSLDPGQSEALGEAWKHVYKVHVASGLPIDVSRIVRWCKQYVSRPSRMQQVLTAVPRISATVVNRILHDDLSVVSERIQDLYSKEWREGLQQSYRVIHDEWVQSCQDAMILMFARWWIELCHQSMQGTLEFTPLQGMVQHIHLWGAYGPPMQPSAKSGILHYMMEVAQTVLVVDAQEAKDKMIAVSTERMKKDLDDLNLAWENLQTSARRMNQSERARMLLENTIKALKTGKGGVDILAGYLPGILYLPQLLPHTKRASKKAAAWIQGCCAAPLDETFKADNDWRTQLSALYKIKRYLSKERWSVQPRSVLNAFTKPSDTTTTNEKPICPRPIHAKALQDSPSASELFGLNIHDECWQWIPRSHFDMLTKQTSQVEGWAKGLIEKMYPGEKNKSTLVFRVVSQITSMSSLLSFLNRIGKNVHEKAHNDELAVKLSHMKTCLRKIPSGKVSSTMVFYACTTVLGMPASIDNGSWTMPTNLTRQDVSFIWDKNYQACAEWNSVGFMMNTDEVQAFITKVREQQKEISLQRLDILSIEDRQTLLDAKNLGLLKIVQFNEIRVDEVHNLDAEMDMEGEEEFALASLDADPHVDSL